MRKLVAVLALVFSAMALATPAQAAPQREEFIADLQSLHGAGPARCLDLADQGRALHAIVYRCTGEPWQKWRFTKHPTENSWEIKPVQHLGNNECLAVEIAGEGHWLERARCNLAPWQRWYKIGGHGGGSPISFRSYYPGPRNRDRCMDIERSGAGERVQAWDCHSASYQNWIHVNFG